MGSVMSEQADLAETFLRGLQDRICTAIEQVDGGARFEEDAWQRAAGGGGRTRVLRDGAVFEQAGVNFSRVSGNQLPPSATVAATVCVMIMLSMMRFATDWRPDSLAAILDLMATPFGCEASTIEIPDAMACRARWRTSPGTGWCTTCRCWAAGRPGSNTWLATKCNACRWPAA